MAHIRIWVLKTENYSKYGMFDETLCPILNYNLYSWNVYPLKKIVNWECTEFEYGSMAFKTMSDVSNIRHIDLYLHDLG